MAKRSTHRISAHQSVETSRDWNGRYYIAYSSGSSVFLRDTQELRKFLRLPKGIPSREAFDVWLAELKAMDAERREPTRPEGISDEVRATGFGPEAHGDPSDPEDDPTANTRTII